MLHIIRVCLTIELCPQTAIFIRKLGTKVVKPITNHLQNHNFMGGMFTIPGNGIGFTPGISGFGAITVVLTFKVGPRVISWFKSPPNYSDN